ncbi:MAG: hypothetical protein AAB470_00075 [Patescibacteria group bacterium]|mgnify:CR=1 FL=1
MRYTEIILKLLFLIGAVSFIITKNILSPLFQVFLVVTILLGITLLLNKNASYYFKQSNRDLTIRKIEGILLIVFSVVVSSLGI